MIKKGLNIGVIITVATLIIGSIAGYTRLQARAEATSEKAEKLEVKIEEVAKENQQLEKNIAEQKIALDYIVRTLDKIDQRIELKKEKEKR